MTGGVEMRLKSLEYFVETVNCGSINDAAKKLYISQPTLSMTIAGLEEDLHTKLLHRTARGVAPTYMGAKVYAGAVRLIRQLNDDWDGWNREITRAAGVAGDVKVLCFPSASTLISKFVIRELQVYAPLIHLQIYEDTVKNDLSFLSNKDFPLIINSCIKDEQSTVCRTIPAEYQVEPLLEDSMSVLISSKNPLSKKAFVSPADCASLPLAYYCYGEEEAPPVYLPLFKQHSHLKFSSRETILQAVAENIAVAIFPRKITQHDFYIKNNLITSVLFDASIQLPKILHYVAYKKDLSPAEETVLDIVRYCIRSYFL